MGIDCTSKRRAASIGVDVELQDAQPAGVLVGDLVGEHRDVRRGELLAVAKPMAMAPADQDGRRRS